MKMKKIIIDANILFAALRVRNSRIRKGLSSSKYKFYCPNYIIVEIFKHKERILKSSKVSEEETYEILAKVIDRVHFISVDNVSTGSYVEAYRLCRSIDEKDTPFVALSLEFECELWTRDKELKSGLKKRGFDHFFNEEEI